MARKKRKKNNNGQSNKQLQATQKNAFIKKLKQVLIMIGGGSVVDLLPKQQWERMYAIRFRTPKTITKGSVNPFLIKIMKYIYNEYLQKTVIEINDGQSIKLIDAIKYIYTFDAYFKCNHDFKGKDEAKKLFNDRVDIDHYTQQVGESIIKHFEYLEIFLSNFDRSIVKADYSFENFSIDLIIQEIKPDVKYFVYKNIKRKAYQVSYSVDQELLPIRIKASALGINNKFGDFPLNVYIQSHAIHRLDERMDMMLPGIPRCSVCVSLQDPVVIEFQGKKMIEVRYLGKGEKIGYLLVDVVDGCILIKTFLLLSNDGTPEGKRLTELLGISKIDKKYLQLDKLSTFLSESVKKNEELKPILMKSGCYALCQIENNDKSIKSHSSDIAAYILEYTQYHQYGHMINEEAIEDEKIPIAQTEQ